MIEQQNNEPWLEALQKFLSAFPVGPLGVERVDLDQASGRILGKDVNARTDNPPYSQALLEGVLVRVRDMAMATVEAPVSLTISGRIEPATATIPPVSSGQCLEVVTGSLIPSGDSEPLAVAGFRDIQREGSRISIKRPLSPGDNIEAQGKEMRAGDRLLAAGCLLGAKEIGLLAGQGILSIDVARRPLVAIFSSGNEVLSPKETLRHGYVWDANSYALSAQCQEAGGVPRFYGILRDDFDAFREALQKALLECDMAAISGGTVAGGRNFISDLVRAAGSPGVIVDGVPMRSGRPLIMGVAGQKPIVTVAGYPPEALRGFDLFGRPAVERLLGRK